MPNSVLIDDGATKVGVAWLVKELFAFLIKWRKADEKEPSSDDNWKDYCRDQFNDLKNSFRGLEQKVDTLEDRIQELRIQHRTCGGKE